LHCTAVGRRIENQIHQHIQNQPARQMMLNFKTSASVDAIPAADWRYQQKSICHSTKIMYNCELGSNDLLRVRGQPSVVGSPASTAAPYLQIPPTTKADEPTNWEIHTLTDRPIRPEASATVPGGCRWSTYCLLVTLLYPDDALGTHNQLLQ